jgi:type VI secretion system protein
MQLNNPILALRVAKFNDEPVAEPITTEFGPAGGTIGRASDCTLVLPDQQRAISRVHARVEYRDGEYLLCDLGSNPSVLNQRALGGTREARLADGDRLLIGPYLLEVTLAERSGGARGLTGGVDPLAAAQVLSGPPLGDLTGDAFGLGMLDPLGQPGFGEASRISSRPGYAGSESDHISPEMEAFSAPVAVPVSRERGEAPVGSFAPASSSPAASFAPSPAVSSPLSSSAHGGIPADYDPLADALAQWETPPAHPSGAPPLASPSPSHYAPPERLAPLAAPPLGTPLPSVQAGPTGLPASLLDGPLSGGETTPFDDLFSSGSPSPPAHAEPGPLDFLAPIPASTPIPIPAAPVAAPASPAAAAFAPLAATPSMPAPASRPEPAAMDESGYAATPYTPAAAPAAPFTPVAQGDSAAPVAQVAAVATAPQPATRASAPATAANLSPTLAALLDGLGLDPSRAPNLPELELARLAGAMLRESLRGTMAVLRARSLTKRENRLEVTVIIARDNNPLKFFPDVDSALSQMLTGRGAGYLPPAAALERAFNDIESHELAVMAGMRAALAHVLGRFDPATIEAQLSEQGVLEKVLSNRKAKLWDRFVELQGAVAREAEDDFQRLFGKAFNDAYEAQIEALGELRRTGAGKPPDRG